MLRSLTNQLFFVTEVKVFEGGKGHQDYVSHKILRDPLASFHYMYSRKIKFAFSHIKKGGHFIPKVLKNSLVLYMHHFTAPDFHKQQKTKKNTRSTEHTFRRIEFISLSHAMFIT